MVRTGAIWPKMTRTGPETGGIRGTEREPLTPP
jgi:hypothetical protein